MPCGLERWIDNRMCGAGWEVLPGGAVLGCAGSRGHHLEQGEHPSASLWSTVRCQHHQWRDPAVHGLAHARTRAGWEQPIPGRKHMRLRAVCTHW